MARSSSSDETLLKSAGLEIVERAASDGRAIYLVSGDTHPHRRILRELGGDWDRIRQSWGFSGDDPTVRIAAALRETPETGVSGLSEDGGAGFEAKRPHYHGHRQRLRQRFMSSGGDGLPDYELLELLLFHSIPRVDVKPLAKELLGKFGGLGAVLGAEPEMFTEFDKVNYQTIVHFRAIREAAARLAREEAFAQPVLASWDKLLDYCRTAMAHSRVETFRLLFLDRKNRLIADEVQQSGTIDHTPVYPREVVKRALELGASAIIMVHNHPSGDPEPSKGDIEMTREVREAAEKLGIALHDHLIIARSGHTSLKSAGLI